MRIHKFKKQFGQSVAEYAMVLLLTTAAILIMGPYLIRAWNAQQKSQEDAIKDAVEDPNILNRPFPSNDCGLCTHVYNCVNPPCCGQGGVNECLQTQSTMTLVCPTDSSCEQAGETICEAHELCCEEVVPSTGLCDNESCGPGGISQEIHCGKNPINICRCVANPNESAQCATGTWTDWQPDTSNDGWTDVSPRGGARWRQCLGLDGLPCKDCLCQETSYSGVNNLRFLDVTEEAYWENWIAAQQ